MGTTEEQSASLQKHLFVCFFSLGISPRIPVSLGSSFSCLGVWKLVLAERTEMNTTLWS